MALFKSLYSRIAAGFVVFLAITLITQAGLFVWVVVQGEAEMGPRALDAVASMVARDLANELTKDPNSNLGAHLSEERFGSLRRPLGVVMADGRVIVGRWGPLPPPLVRVAQMRLRGEQPPPRQDFPQPRPDGDQMRRPPDTWLNGVEGALGVGAGAGPDRRRRTAFAPIVVHGQTVGMVVALAGRPSTSVLSEIGPVLGFTALCLVTAVGALATVLIFRPAHHRLKLLSDAARRFGAGDRTVRVAEDGVDEIASVARAFNRMASDLAQRATQLEEGDRLRRQLLADVSHELMTPLTAIRGYTETLAMPALSADEPTRNRYLEIVREETARLEGIIGDLLDLARLEAGGGSFTIQDVRVADVFARVLDRHGQAACEKGVTIGATGAEGLELAGDRLRLEQAVQNLAANALRHTPSGGRIDLKAERRDNMVAISVTDTGEGIAPEHLPYVFDRFYKADTSRIVGGYGTGSGLGLSIVKAIVERHGGSVSVRSTTGVGTTFEMLLPAD